MRHGLSLLIVLVSLLLVGSVALAEGPSGFDVNGGYLFATYKDDASHKGSGFVVAASTNITDRIGAKFSYQTISVTDYTESYSGIELLGSYQVVSTDKYVLSALAGWKSSTDATWVDDMKISGIALGAEVVAPVSETLTVRGTFLLAPSAKYAQAAAEGTDTMSKLAIAATLTLPSLPVKVEGGYTSESYNWKNEAAKATAGGLFVGARTSF